MQGAYRSTDTCGSCGRRVDTDELSFTDEGDAICRFCIAERAQKKPTHSRRGLISTLAFFAVLLCAALAVGFYFWSQPPPASHVHLIVESPDAERAAQVETLLVEFLTDVGLVVSTTEERAVSDTRLSQDELRDLTVAANTGYVVYVRFEDEVADGTEEVTALQYYARVVSYDQEGSGPEHEAVLPLVDDLDELVEEATDRVATLAFAQLTSDLFSFPRLRHVLENPNDAQDLEAVMNLRQHRDAIDGQREGWSAYRQALEMQDTAMDEAADAGVQCALGEPHRQALLSVSADGRYALLSEVEREPWVPFEAQAAPQYVDLGRSLVRVELQSGGRKEIGGLHTRSFENVVLTQSGSHLLAWESGAERRLLMIEVATGRERVVGSWAYDQVADFRGLSPDGTSILALGSGARRALRPVIVINLESGEARTVSRGRDAFWVELALSAEEGLTDQIVVSRDGEYPSFDDDGEEASERVRTFRHLAVVSPERSEDANQGEERIVGGFDYHAERVWGADGHHLVFVSGYGARTWNLATDEVGEVQGSHYGLGQVLEGGRAIYLSNRGAELLQLEPLLHSGPRQELPHTNGVLGFHLAGSRLVFLKQDPFPQLCYLDVPDTLGAP